MHRHSLLSKPAILAQLRRGGIIIDPFDERCLKSVSYDVRLGENFFRRHGTQTGRRTIFNPYDPEAVKEHFDGPYKAKPAGDFDSYDPESPDWKNINLDDRIIMIQPHELILGHTMEFIGGTRDPKISWGFRRLRCGIYVPWLYHRCFTAEMKARSSIGRIGTEVCRCAGWGDVGYINRWTMEIKNDDPKPVIFVVGTRVAQMKFYEVDPVETKDLYGVDSSRDRYQNLHDLKIVKDIWSESMLLPRLTKD